VPEGAWATLDGSLPLSFSRRCESHADFESWSLRSAESAFSLNHENRIPHSAYIFVSSEACTWRSEE
jgi:hypothetical protein